jgi:hypothetical protein
MLDGLRMGVIMVVKLAPNIAWRPHIKRTAHNSLELRSRAAIKEAVHGSIKPAVQVRLCSNTVFPRRWPQSRRRRMANFGDPRPRAPC